MSDNEGAAVVRLDALNGGIRSLRNSSHVYVRVLSGSGIAPPR